MQFVEDVVIIGAGIAGLCAAIRLRASGVHNIRILEQSAEVGGTWRDNTYPGCACDVPSHLYSYSFAPNTQWTRPYPQQKEIQSYVLEVTKQYEIRALIHFDTTVTALHWVPEQSAWRITCGGQTQPLLARYVIVATGPLNKPLIPDLPGIHTFAGEVFHSGQWNHGVSLAGKRVAVLGTGASAVQFVPEIAPSAAQVTVFQRTAAWVLPRWDQPYGVLQRWAYRWVPGLQRLSRWRVYWFNEWIGMGFMGSKWMQTQLRRLAEHHLRHQVADQSLLAALTPSFSPGCKRLLISNTWFPTLQRSNVALVTQAAKAVTPQGVLGADGRHYACDVIIWGTGFKATEFIAPMQIYGEQDPAIAAAQPNSPAPELGDLWRRGPAATHLGITVAGFPNFFMLVGPNTGLGHNSLIFMIECQVNYIVGALSDQRARGRPVLRLRPDVQQDGYGQVQHKMRATVWASGCKSWYQNADGHIDTLWPAYTWEYWLKTRRFNRLAYA